MRALLTLASLILCLESQGRDLTPAVIMLRGERTQSTVEYVGDRALLTVVGDPAYGERFDRYLLAWEGDGYSLIHETSSGRSNCFEVECEGWLITKVRRYEYGCDDSEPLDSVVYSYARDDEDDPHVRYITRYYTDGKGRSVERRWYVGDDGYGRMLWLSSPVVTEDGEALNIELPAYVWNYNGGAENRTTANLSMGLAFPDADWWTFPLLTEAVPCLGGILPMSVRDAMGEKDAPAVESFSYGYDAGGHLRAVERGGKVVMQLNYSDTDCQDGYILPFVDEAVDDVGVE